MYDLVLKNGKIILSDAMFDGTIAVKNGKIAAISDHDSVPEAKDVIDVKGNYIFPKP